MGLPLGLVGLIVLSIVPGIVSLVVGGDSGGDWEICELVLLLGKSGGWGSWVESGSWALAVLNPIEVVGSGDVSLLRPGDLVGLIVLLVGPGVVSLEVWGDVRVAILNWVDLLLGKSSSWGSWVESGGWALTVLDPIEVIGSSGVSLLGPGDLVGLIVLLIGP